MSKTDMTKFFQTPTIENKKYIYSMWFSTGTNTTASFADKIELYTLISYLTQIMQKKNPEQYKSSLNVLQKIYPDRDFDKDQTGFGDYIVGLSIICDDLLWGINDVIPKPEWVKTPNDVVNKIKLLIEQWLPF